MSIPIIDNRLFRQLKRSNDLNEMISGSSPEGGALKTKALHSFVTLFSFNRTKNRSKSY